MNTWKPQNNPFLVVCNVPGERTRIVGGFDDFSEAIARCHLLNQSTNTRPYKVKAKNLKKLIKR